MELNPQKFTQALKFCYMYFIVIVCSYFILPKRIFFIATSV